MESVIFRAQIFSLTIIPSQGDLKWTGIVPCAPNPTANHFFFATAGGFGAHEGASAGQPERCWHLGAIVLSPLGQSVPLPFSASPWSRHDNQKLEE